MTLTVIYHHLLESSLVRLILRFVTFFRQHVGQPRATRRETLIKSIRRTKLPDRSPEAQAVRNSHIARYCSILESQNILYLFIADEVLNHYGVPAAYCDQDLKVVVDDVEAASRAMENAGLRNRPRYIMNHLTTQHEPEWQARYGPKVITRSSTGTPYIVLLRTSDWQLRPRHTSSTDITAHMPSIPEFVHSVLSNVVWAERGSGLWTYSMELCMLAYRYIPIVDSLDFASLLPPRYRMIHSQFVVEQALCRGFYLSREDTERYRMVSEDGTISDEDEIKVCQHASERIQTTVTQMTRRDSAVSEAGLPALPPREWLWHVLWTGDTSYELLPCQ